MNPAAGTPNMSSSRPEKIILCGVGKLQKFDSQKHEEGINQQALNRQSAERTANRSPIIPITSALVALASCIAAWIAVFVK